MAKAIEAIARKAVKKGVGLLRKTKLENEALQQIQKLKLEKASPSFTKAKAKKEGVELKLDLEQNQVGFIEEKKDLEVAYQQ